MNDDHIVISGPITGHNDRVSETGCNLLLPMVGVRVVVVHDLVCKNAGRSQAQRG